VFQKQLQDRAAIGGLASGYGTRGSPGNFYSRLSILSHHQTSITQPSMKKPSCSFAYRGAAILLMAWSACFGPAQGSELCSPSKLVALKQARSIVSEASFSTELYALGKTNSLFNNELLKQANDELTNARKALENNDEAVALVDAAQSEIQGNGTQLGALADEFFTLERANERCP
jgi:hypothetical protein